MHKLKIGRDALFRILGENEMLVKKRKTRVRTTNSSHWLHKYPNLVKDFEASKPNELWVSDITYIKVGNEFCYLFLITDAYSRKIVGWYLSKTLEAKGAVMALKMALSSNETPDNLIHHSDRGVQYCSAEYVDNLNDNGIKISMTENSDPRENAIAERVNGILKDEWLNDIDLKNFEQAKDVLKRIINVYNTERLHDSLDHMTPEKAHEQAGIVFKKRWKKYYKKNIGEMIILNKDKTQQFIEQEQALRDF